MSGDSLRIYEVIWDALERPRDIVGVHADAIVALDVSATGMFCGDSFGSIARWAYAMCQMGWLRREGALLARDIPAGHVRFHAWRNMRPTLEAKLCANLRDWTSEEGAVSALGDLVGPFREAVGPERFPNVMYSLIFCLERQGRLERQSHKNLWRSTSIASAVAAPAAPDAPVQTSLLEGV
jgi:hypothetical protein